MIQNPDRPPQPVFVLFLIYLSLLSGCSSMGYYYQAARGQLEIWQQRQPITAILDQEPADSDLARRLHLVQDILHYAHIELALPNNGSYRHYADLQRPYVVWNLFAAPELSLEPKQWCYPLLGCLNYRGYFNAEDALAEARELQQQGWDTYVGGVLAYSTLGWFKDPVLNTFWQLDDLGLASLIFHELAHSLVFVADDTTFNESFATAVELYGTGQWLAQQAPEALDWHVEQAQHSQQDRHVQHLQLLQARFEQRQQVFRIVSESAEHLRQLYASELPDRLKQDGKQRLFQELQARYQQLRQSWGEDLGFDGWFQTPFSNAKLITLTSYYDAVPMFLEKIRQLNGDLPAFYDWVRQLADRPKAERDAILATLAPASADGPIPAHGAAPNTEAWEQGPPGVFKGP